MSHISTNNYGHMKRNEILPDIGWPRCLPIPLNAFTLTDGAALGAISSNALGLVVKNSQLVMRFAAAATTTDIAKLSIPLPSDYAKYVNDNPGYRTRPVLAVRAKKTDVTGSATDNDNLALTMNVAWNNPVFTSSAESDGDTATNTMATAVSNELDDIVAADGADANPENTRLYLFKFAGNTTGGMTAAQIRALQPGASMTISLAPHETVGSNLAIDVYSVELWYPGNDRIMFPDLHKNAVHY